MRAAARAPVDEPDVHARAAAADSDHPAAPIPDAQCGSRSRVVAARVRVMTDADTRLAVPRGRTPCALAGRTRPGHRRRLADRASLVRLVRPRARRERALFVGEIGDRGKRRRGARVFQHGVGRRARERTELDRVEISGGQCRRGRWGSSGCGGGDPQRRKRAEKRQCARSSAVQTRTPVTICSSGRRG